MCLFLPGAAGPALAKLQLGPGLVAMLGRSPGWLGWAPDLSRSRLVLAGPCSHRWLSQGEFILALPGRDLTGRDLALALANSGINLVGPWN